MRLLSIYSKEGAQWVSSLLSDGWKLSFRYSDGPKEIICLFHCNGSRATVFVDASCALLKINGKIKKSMHKY